MFACVRVCAFMGSLVEADRRGELLLKRTEDLGMTFTTIAEEIFSFGYIGGFLITSVMDELVRDTPPGDGTPPPWAQSWFPRRRNARGLRRTQTGSGLRRDRCVDVEPQLSL